MPYTEMYKFPINNALKFQPYTPQKPILLILKSSSTDFFADSFWHGKRISFSQAAFHISPIDPSFYPLRKYEYPQFPQQEIRSIFMVNLRLQSILASMAKYYWILHYLSLLLSRLKHSFICKGVIGQNADIHYRLCAQDEIRRTHVN